MTHNGIPLHVYVGMVSCEDSKISKESYLIAFGYTLGEGIAYIDYIVQHEKNGKLANF
jgi:hypothetical protein